MSRLEVVPATELTPSEKLQMSLEMFEYGCAMMRQNLRREHPDADAAALDELLRAWLRTRPGAEHGDADGHPTTWPRSRDVRAG